MEGAGPRTSFGGHTRRKADLRLVDLNGVGGSAAATFGITPDLGDPPMRAPAATSLPGRRVPGPFL